MVEREKVVVCGVDGSLGSQQALEWAREEAVRRGCALRVVTAWTWDGIEALGAVSSPGQALEQARQVQESALRQCGLGAEDTEGSPDVPKVERMLPRDGSVDALTAAAADAELLVLGSHGHGLVHDKLVGSTSSRAIHHAPCPVVVLPDPRHAEHQRERARTRRRAVGVPPQVGQPS